MMFRLAATATLQPQTEISWLTYFEKSGLREEEEDDDEHYHSLLMFNEKQMN